LADESAAEGGVVGVLQREEWWGYRRRVSVVLVMHKSECSVGNAQTRVSVVLVMHKSECSVGNAQE
jgi:hypothetical protein